MFGVENVLVIYLGATAVLNGGMSVGMLFAFMAYKTQFVDKAARFVEKAIEFRMLDVQLERLADIVRTEPEPDLARATVPTSYRRELKGAVEVRELSFRYWDDEPFVFENANFSIAPGEYVAITGPSGGGKTTLIKVMLGLLRPSSGDILIDGMPLRQFGIRAFRDQVGVVMQDDQLLSGSVADNICCFDEKFDVGMDADLRHDRRHSRRDHAYANGLQQSDRGYGHFSFRWPKAARGSGPRAVSPAAHPVHGRGHITFGCGA